LARNEQSRNDELHGKLDLLAILLAAQIGGGLTLSERVPLLYRLGLDRKQIAVVCDTSPAVVSVRLAEARRKPKRRPVGRKVVTEDE
jgi:hypothetical protein